MSAYLSPAALSCDVNEGNIPGLRTNVERGSFECGGLTRLKMLNAQQPETGGMVVVRKRQKAFLLFKKHSLCCGLRKANYPAPSDDFSVTFSLELENC